MKILLDSCVWSGAREALERAGHDVAWVGDWGEDPGDEEILAQAHAEGHVLVTLDKDFGEIAIVQGAPHSGIVRLVNLSVKMQADVCVKVLELHGGELQAGAIVTAEAGRLRLRPAE